MLAVAQSCMQAGEVKRRHAALVSLAESVQVPQDLAGLRLVAGARIGFSEGDQRQRPNQPIRAWYNEPAWTARTISRPKREILAPLGPVIR